MILHFDLAFLFFRFPNSKEGLYRWYGERLRFTVARRWPFEEAYPEVIRFTFHEGKHRGDAPYEVH